VTTRTRFDYFRASLRASHLGELCSEDGDAVGSADRVARVGRDLSSALQSGFQPTCEPTGFQPVERPFSCVVEESRVEENRLPVRFAAGVPLHQWLEFLLQPVDRRLRAFNVLGGDGVMKWTRGDGSAGAEPMTKISAESIPTSEPNDASTVQR
jgi:hypothetical protein